MSVRITDLPEATELNGSELMPIVQNGVTRRTTLDFVNQAAPAALILQQTQQVLADTQQVLADTQQVKAETDQVLVSTEGVYNQTVMVQGQVDISIADWETQYLGAKSDLPTTDNEGNPLQKGALYWDTSLNAMFVWDGTSWTAFSSAVASVNGQIGEVVLDYTNVGAAASARTLTAGNGLTGGGDLTADRTLALGTPSTLTTGTTNSVSATSHTHEVTFPVTSVAGKTGAVALAVADVSNAVATSDARLSDSREWTGSTVTQAEAEAGTATTRRAWTAQRVFQAIAAWWNASAFKTKLDGIEAGAQVNTVTSVAGRTGAVVVSKADVGLGNVSNDAQLKIASNLSDINNAAAARTNLGLGNAAVANILGTVSQSSGVPTGAIIERGSNANGDYVRFADGTQICTRVFLASTLTHTAITLLNSQSGDYRTSQSPVSYAAVFSGQPSYAGVSWENQPSGWWASAFPLDPSAAQVNLRATNSVAAPTDLNANIYLVAIGRWF